jgi:hypothetical protein
MSEYQIKMRVPTYNLLPPYHISGIEVYEADTAKRAIEMAKAEFREAISTNADVPDDLKLEIVEVMKL